MEATRDSGGSRASEPGPDVVVKVATHESELRAIRREVGRFMADAGGSEDVVEDFKIVVSELATNVMHHSAADLVTIAMRRIDGGWQLDVYDADDIPDLSDVCAPVDTSLSGRGLLVVKGLMDETDIIVGSDERVLIRCTKFDG